MRFVFYLANGSGNYHLQCTSPALNKGDPTYAPSTNFDGSIRDATPDIEAY